MVHFPEIESKGGEADGVEAPALPAVSDHGPLDHGLHSPKSVLAARPEPERLTFQVSR